MKKNITFVLIFLAFINITLGQNTQQASAQPVLSSPDLGAFENPYGTPQHQTLVNVPADYATIQEAIDQ